MAGDTLLIVGADKIAAALGVSLRLLRRDLLKRPGFPAKRLTGGGPWMSTPGWLTAWAEAQLPPPEFPPRR